MHPALTSQAKPFIHHVLSINIINISKSTLILYEIFLCDPAALQATSFMAKRYHEAVFHPHGSQTKNRSFQLDQKKNPVKQSVKKCREKSVHTRAGQADRQHITYSI
ncbi:hypothetical protein [Komagataeibacter xylinus]|uniref:hypothetical protein n=1 Tax=Komagataeibacter xylinus TaxID=28448 RepID=UPI00280AA3C1|nr:hypothetical protein [Komagataeibacter xylinus]